jgi:Fe-S-cluster containining protein
MNVKEKTCSRCGTCCTKGGPALHLEDLSLIREGKITRENLITIRMGELVYKPFASNPEPVKCELVKICGIGREWQCHFFEGEGKGCAIYEHRPQACRELQCWNTEAVEGLVEKDTISRFDIIDKDEPIYAFIERHDKKCRCPDIYGLYEAALVERFPEAGEFEDIVNTDIAIRTEALSALKISLAEELFYFGRPIFQLLQQIGARVTENSGKLFVNWPK